MTCSPCRVLVHFQEAQHQILNVESVDPASWHSFETSVLTEHLYLFGRKMYAMNLSKTGFV
jgi:hypothetical protein